MLSIIVDTSVTIKWYSAVDEQNVPQADEILDEIAHQNLNCICPEIILLELTNVLRIGKQSAENKCKEALEDFKRLPIQLVKIPEMKDLIKVMYKFQLTSYDAVFIALSISMNIPIITADYKHHKKSISPNIFWLSEWDKN